MRKWIAGLAAALGIGAVATIAAARDITVSAAYQAEVATFVASWRAVPSQIAGCPSYRVTWTVAGVPTAGKTLTVTTDTLRVTRAAGAAQTTASVAVVAVCGSTSSATRSASRTVTWPVVPVDSTPGAVDSLRVDVATGGPPVIVPPPPDTTPTPPPVGDFADASHMPSTGMRLWFDDDLDNMAQDEYPNANGIRLYMRGAEWRTQDASTPYSNGAVRQSYEGNGLGNGYGIGIMLREEGVWPRQYNVAMVKFEGSNGQPYKVHANDEKTLFNRVYTVDGQPDNGGPNFGYDSNAGYVRCFMQLPINNAPRLYQNRPVYFQVGQWQKVEHYIQTNTPGNADGIWRMWINGQLAAEHTNIRFSNSTTEQTGFFGTRYETVRGGGADNGPTPAGGQSRLYDRIATYVSSTVR